MLRSLTNIVGISWYNHYRAMWANVMHLVAEVDAFSFRKVLLDVLEIPAVSPVD